MDKPLTIWYCDVCGKPINDVNEVLLIWKSDKNMKDYDFKFVHKATNEKRGCDMESYPSNMHLSEFLGLDGMAYLMSFLSHGNAIRKNGNSIKNLDEFIDVIRRIQTPYYEEARRYFHTEKTQRLIEGCNEYYPYTQNILKKIIEINTK